VKQTAAHLIDGLEGRARAFVQVQNGCDHRCTFCIIPYGRGNSRSVPMGEVIAQVRSLCARGYREIVLTGVDLTSYGANLPGAPKLGTLVKQIFKHVPEVARLRLSSIDSVEADRELLDAFGAETRLMPHLHLSLQAGDDLILKRMKRRHSRADAIRARRLREKGQAALRCHLEAQVGAKRQVLVESSELGRTEHFTRARLAAPMQPGMILDVTVAGHDGRQLLTA
jgi:threonylcarbamoyladenosine tRNA methylthiotransferase MtaB